MKFFYRCPVYDECFKKRLSSNKDRCEQVSKGFCTKFIEVIKKMKKGDDNE